MPRREDGEFYVGYWESTPYLVEDGLPYEAGIDSCERPYMSLDGDWFIAFDPDDRGIRERWFENDRVRARSDGATIVLPATVNASRSEHADYQGPVWFARTIEWSEPEQPAPKTPRVADASRDSGASGGSGDRDSARWLRLRLEGFLIRATVWVNGRIVLSREGGFTDAFADLGTAPTGEPNGEPLHVVMRVDNRHTPYSLPMRLGPYHTPGWHTYLGVHRSIHLELMPARWIFKCEVTPVENGLALTALVHERSFGAESTASASPPFLSVEVTGPNGARQAAQTVSPESRTETDVGAVLGYRATIAVNEIVRWSPHNPATYRFRVSLSEGGVAPDGGSAGDAVDIVTGWRSVGVRGGAIVLNNEPVFLRGICKHEDHPELGSTNPPELATSDLQRIHAMRANYVRTAHYPHARHELAAARDMGLLMAEEIPFYQAGNGFIHWYSDKRPLGEFPLGLFGLRHLKNRRLMRNAHRQLMEMVERDRNNPAIILWGIANESYTLGRRAVAVYRRLRDTVREFDATRLVTLAEFTYGKKLLDRRRRGGDVVDVLSVNAYYGWYYGKKEDVDERLRELHGRYPDLPILLSEFGAGAVRGRHESDGPYAAPRIPPGRTFSEEHQAALLEHYVNVAKRLPFVHGVSPWVYADFYCPEFPHNPVPYFNLKGVCTADRVPKVAYGVLRRLYSEPNESLTDSEDGPHG